MIVVRLVLMMIIRESTSVMGRNECAQRSQRIVNFCATGFFYEGVIDFPLCLACSTRQRARLASTALRGRGLGDVVGVVCGRRGRLADGVGVRRRVVWANTLCTAGRVARRSVDVAGHVACGERRRRGRGGDGTKGKHGGETTTRRRTQVKNARRVGECSCARFARSDWLATHVCPQSQEQIPSSRSTMSLQARLIARTASTLALSPVPKNQGHRIRTAAALIIGCVPLLSLDLSPSQPKR